MNNAWYLYRHIRLDKNEPFYIGVGKKANYFRAYEATNNKRSKSWNEIVKQTEFEVDILLDNLSEKEAYIKENEFIELYGRIDLGTGTLCNQTNGGKGLSGTLFSEETRNKISSKMLGHNNHRYGKKATDETRARMSKSHLGKKHSPEECKNQSLRTISSGQAKAVEVFDYYSGDFIGEYYAISEACRELGIPNNDSKACLVAKGKRKQTKGYVFKYK